MRDPTVTVITPTHNRPDSLAACIASVVAQTFPDWEQLVLDDGSEIPATEVAARIRDSRVRVIRRSHVGILRLAELYNAALSQARGQLIAILEDDDLWPTDKLALQVQAFADPDVVLSWGRAQIINAGGTPVGLLPTNRTPFSSDVFENTPCGRALSLLLVQNFIPACTVITRQRSLTAIGGFKGAGLPYVDYPTWLELALAGKFAFSPQVCGVWRLHSGQTTVTRTVEQQESAASLALKFFDRLPPAMKDLSGFSRSQLIASGQDRVGRAHLWRGRFRAFEGNSKGAREDFIAAATRSSPRTRALALGAMMAHSLGIDIEQIARRLGRLSVEAQTGRPT